MKLFDSHAHIGSPELMPEAREIMTRAREAGVAGVIAVGAGYGVSLNAAAVALAEEHEDVWATAGVHPHDAEQWNELAERAIDGWLSHQRVVAVGECGLDYWYEHAPREAQRECLRAQILLGHAANLPLVIHVRPSRDSRDAFEEITEIFDDCNADQLGGIIHCFTGDLPFAEACIARGFDISFSGILTFKNAEELREVARALPLECLHIETDSPLLAPVPYRGKRNEPSLVGAVASCLAEIKETNVETIADATYAHTCRAFGIEAGA